MGYAVSASGLVSAQYEIVTPDIARRWLAECNNVNRKFRPARSMLLADDMVNEEFDGLNGDTVGFDVNGQMTNGQHRVSAIVTSNVPQELLVVRGVRPEARPTIDDGLKRRFADDLAMKGITQGMLRESLIRMIVTWDRGGGLADIHYRPARKFLTQRYALYGKEITETVEEAKRFWNRWPGNRNAMMFTWWLLAIRLDYDRDKVNRFFSTMVLGSQAEEDEMLVRLRERLSKPIAYGLSGMAIHMHSGAEVWWLLQGWNRWITGSRVRYQKPDEKTGITDPYPIPRKPEATA